MYINLMLLYIIYYIPWKLEDSSFARETTRKKNTVNFPNVKMKNNEYILAEAADLYLSINNAVEAVV